MFFSTKKSTIVKTKLRVINRKIKLGFDFLLHDSDFTHAAERALHLVCLKCN